MFQEATIDEIINRTKSDQDQAKSHSWNEANFKNLELNSYKYQAKKMQLAAEFFSVNHFLMQGDHKTLNELRKPHKLPDGMTVADVRESKDKKSIIKNHPESLQNIEEKELYDFFEEKGLPVAKTELGIDGLYVEKIPFETKFIFREMINYFPGGLDDVLTQLSKIIKLSAQFDSTFENNYSIKEKENIRKKTNDKYDSKFNTKTKEKKHSLRFLSKIKSAKDKEYAFKTIQKYATKAEKEFGILTSDNHLGNWRIENRENEMKCKRIDFNNKRINSIVEESIKHADVFLPIYSYNNKQPIFNEFDTEYGTVIGLDKTNKTIAQNLYIQTLILNLKNPKTKSLRDFKKSLETRVPNQSTRKIIEYLNIIRPLVNMQSAAESLEKLSEANDFENIYLGIKEVNHYCALARIHLENIKHQLPSQEYEGLKSIIEQDIKNGVKKVVSKEKENAANTWMDALFNPAKYGLD